MKVEVADTESKLSALREAWDELASRCSSLSMYSSHDYNVIAWKHLSGAGDRLLVLAIFDGGRLEAIAPFCVTRQRVHGIPFRSIGFIAAWEGDKPSIIAPSGGDAAWEAIFDFLSTGFTSWDVLDIKEQPRDSAILSRCAFLHDRRFVCQVTHDSTSYHVDLSGGWESYYEARSASVKKRLRKRSQALNALPGGLSVETITQPERVTEALDRLVALEKRSWKVEDGIGIHGTAPLRRFYEEFTRLSARRNQVAVVFLRAADKDIACYLNYMYRDVVLARHTAYDEEYSRLAPGIHLKAHIIRSLFGTEFREFDEMGMHPRKGAPMGKVEWASGTRETRRLLVQKRNLRLMPVLLGRRLKALFRASRPNQTNGKASIDGEERSAAEGPAPDGP